MALKKKIGQIVVGNWKMNPQSVEEALTLFRGIAVGAAAARHAEVVIASPAVYLEALSREKSPMKLGAQNVFASDKSTSHTGEISGAMLKNLKVSHVIIGHSERRKMGENNAVVNEKLLSALKDGFISIVCIGEDRRDLDGFYLTTLAKQIEEALSKVQKKFAQNVLIAYEPVWAIGKDSKGPATPADVLEIVLYIKKVLHRLWGKEGAKVRVLYGGSVDAKNAKEFVVGGGVDGLLVGRESLNAKAFSELLLNIRV